MDSLSKTFDETSCGDAEEGGRFVELCDGMVVCLMIYRLTDIEGGYASYDRLVDALEDSMDPLEISANLDYVFDLGMIYGRWVDTGDGFWRRAYYVCEEAKPFVMSAYNRSTMRLLYEGPLPMTPRQDPRSSRRTRWTAPSSTNFIPDPSMRCHETIGCRNA